METIGKGSYGEVKKLIHKASGDFRAMKIIKKEECSKEFISSLLNEIEILRDLDHPNIVKLFEFYQDRLNFYLITEFIEGGELFDKITEVRCFTEAKAAHIMEQLLQATVYCHKHKIVHRDLKPENLLLLYKSEDDLTIKVIDFGTSRTFDPNTKMQHKFGTPYYIAPEVLKKMYDEKCDVWSCGVIMYILLCGYPPFRGKGHKEIFEKIKKGSFDMTGSEWKNVSNEAKAMIDRMLTYKPSSRASAEEALHHPWIKMFKDQNVAAKFNEPLMGNLAANLHSFKIEQKLQQAVLAYFGQQMNFDENKQRLTEIFKAFDTNGDGQLDRDELIAGYTKFYNGDTMRAILDADEIMNKLDFNQNGSIDYSEFMIANLDKSKLLKEERLKEAFELFDVDKSGTITIDEIKKILGCNAEEIDEAEWKQIVEEVDENGDGEISFDEFQKMMHNMFEKEEKAASAQNNSNASP